MQNFLSQAMEAAEDSGLHPVQGYPTIEHAQYDNSQYGFAQDPNSFPIDQNLEMSVNFVSSDGKNQHEGLGNNHMSLSGQNGHAGVMRSHQGSTNTSGSLTTTTQSQTPLNASTKRKSPEDITENLPAGGDSRRKRSKVSRACDQCRRKKVRCDADSGDGNLKTCTNCIKQGQTCDYNRIPQKRGPSKGYIKDLSERVHHLEDSLANAGNYRSSLDAGTYADAPFSPDDDPAQRRQTSISQQRSPFADFTRERFPSIGGWNNNSQASIFPRDRGSIAIPPDQLGPSQPASARSTKPRWVDHGLLPPEATKTTAEIQETEKLLGTTQMDHYYEIVHPQCAILPDSAKTVGVLVKATHEYVEAFSGAMNLLPHRNTDRTFQGKTKEELEAFIKEKGLLKWAERSSIDSLVLLWITLILHVAYLHDMRAHEKQERLVEIELGLGIDFVKGLQFVLDPHEYDWIRSLNTAAIFVRLDAISHGNSTDPLPSSLSSYLNTDWQVVTPQSRFIYMMTDIIQAGLSAVTTDALNRGMTNSDAIGRLQAAAMRGWVATTAVNPEEPMIKGLQAFMALLSMRAITPAVGLFTLTHVHQLVETVRVSFLQQDEDRYLFNPLRFHAVTLATTVLIELKSSKLGLEYSKAMFDTATQEMVKELTSLVKRRDQLDKGIKGLFWAQALVDLVEEKIGQSAEEAGTERVVSDLVWILEYGYLDPLLKMISK